MSGRGGTYADRVLEGASSVDNALRILRTFSYSEPTLGVSELARRLGMGKSTVHRLLQALVRQGFVTRTPEGRYRLGLVVHELGQLVVHGLRLRQVAHPILEQLRFATDETVHLAVLEGAEVVYIERLESASTMRMFDRAGPRLPASVTSSGKCLLAWAPPDVVEGVIASGLVRRAPRTISSEVVFHDALDEVRRRGYAVSVEEGARDIASVAAPVRGSDGSVVAAVSVAGPVLRVNESTLARLVPMVRRAAGQISAGMGYRPEMEMTGPSSSAAST
jgi:IclR family KDG regulon transcriptional repressor